MIRNPKLSIVITCYNRREYLLEAIDSAINQNVERALYEIILIKNFEDKEIDLKCSRFGIKSIIMSGTIGEYMRRALVEANGEIISFLEDDDQFLPNKVSTILRMYEEGRFNLLHNDFIEIDDEGNVHKSVRKRLHMTDGEGQVTCSFDNINSKAFVELLKSDADFNISCMSISSAFASKVFEFASEITAAPDAFLFYLALGTGRVVAIPDSLTRYRMHESTTNASRTFLQFQNSFETEGIRQIVSMEKIEHHIEHSLVRKFLSDEITIRKLKLYSIIGRKGYDQLINVRIFKVRNLTDFQLKFFFIWSTMYILSRLLDGIPGKIVYRYMMRQRNKYGLK